jgi:hypothetical protein
MDKQNNTPPPWSEAPPWANYRAQDEDGTWGWFEEEPVYQASDFFGYEWCSNGRMLISRKDKPNPNWRDTFEKRVKDE